MTASHYVFTSASEDDAADVADSLRRESQEAMRRIRRAIEARFLAAGRPAPTFHTVEELGGWLGKRKPVGFSAASMKAWDKNPLITEDDKTLARDLTHRLARVAAQGNQIAFITGGTEFGPEKMLHEEAHNQGAPVLSLLTENTNPDEVSLNVTHFAFAGINWFGKSRPMLRDIIQNHGGEMVFIGGGAILKDEIELAGNLKIPMHLLRGPVGAAKDMAASRFPAQGFDTFEQLMARMSACVGALSGNQ